jgi:hypothetical protein
MTGPAVRINDPLPARRLADATRSQPDPTHAATLKEHREVILQAVTADHRRAQDEVGPVMIPDIDVQEKHPEIVPH